MANLKLVLFLLQSQFPAFKTSFPMFSISPNVLVPLFTSYFPEKIGLLCMNFLIFPQDLPAQLPWEPSSFLWLKRKFRRPALPLVLWIPPCAECSRTFFLGFPFFFSACQSLSLQWIVLTNFQAYSSVFIIIKFSPVHFVCICRQFSALLYNCIFLMELSFHLIWVFSSLYFSVHSDVLSPLTYGQHPC